MISKYFWLKKILHEDCYCTFLKVTKDQTVHIKHKIYMCWFSSSVSNYYARDFQINCSRKLNSIISCFFIWLPCNNIVLPHITNIATSSTLPKMTRNVHNHQLGPLFNNITTKPHQFCILSRSSDIIIGFFDSDNIG